MVVKKGRRAWLSPKPPASSPSRSWQGKSLGKAAGDGRAKFIKAETLPSPLNFRGGRRIYLGGAGEEEF